MDIKKILNKYRIGFPRLDIENSQALTFHENSKLNDLDFQILGRNIAYFLLPQMVKNISRPIKPYPYANVIELPKPIEINESFDKLVKNRKSTRQFIQYRLTREEISTFLYYTYGKTRKEIVYNEIPFDHRTVPSAGGLYPLEIYLILLNSELESGVYHYRADLHALEFINEKFKTYDDIKYAFYLEYTIETENISAILIMTIFFERIMLKYGERGYRFAVMEAGFASQNLHLAIEALGLGMCMVGGYNDYKLENEILNINPNFESVINVAVIGKPRIEIDLDE